MGTQWLRVHLATTTIGCRTTGCTSDGAGIKEITDCTSLRDDPDDDMDSTSITFAMNELVECILNHRRFADAGRTQDQCFGEQVERSIAIDMIEHDEFKDIHVALPNE